MNPLLDIRLDIRYGFRLLRRSPLFTTAAIVSLALGIGSNAAIFQLIDTIRLRSLTVANPAELAEVRADGPQAFGNYDGVNAKATYSLWKLIAAQQRAFSGIFAWGDAEFLVGRGAEARTARGLWVSGGFFQTLGILPERGRLLAPADDRRGCGAGSVVVSHAFWQGQLDGRDGVVGSTLTLLDRPFTIVGVVPASFQGLEVGRTFDVALPLCSAEVWDSRLDQRDRWWLTIMGRLKPDWTISSANQQIRTSSPALLDATIAPGYDAERIEVYRRLRFGVFPASRGVSRLRDEHGTSLTLLLGLTGLVLLITCGNVATLMLVRASAREREIAVRIAIGASRARLVSQILIESLLLAAAAAAAAVPVAVLSARALVAFLDTPANPINLPLTVDWQLIAFAGCVSGLAAVLFGLLPALRMRMVDPILGLRQGARGSSADWHHARFQRALVIAQIAVSLVLIFAALQFVHTFRNLAAVDVGFEPERTLALALMDHASEGLSAEQKTVFQERLTSEIRSVPGVAAAASSTHIPLSGSMWAHFFRVVGSREVQHRASRFVYVSPGYFETLKIPIRAGRDFSALDQARSRGVMLVNESFVRSHLNGVNPIGTMVRRLAEPGFPETTYEIIGVVGDTKYADLREEDCWCDRSGGSMAPIAYVPIAQNPSPYAWAPVIVRSSMPVAGVTAAIGHRVERLNRSIAIQFIELKTEIRERLIQERMIAWLAGAFGALAMTLVAVGLYSIIAYIAASRRHEIGIRLALGSTRTRIVGLVLGENVWLMGAGIAAGVPLALASLYATRSLLFGLTPTNLPAVVAAACLLASTGALATALPAWRAARVSPDEALRSE